jgi:hypothetical protein
LQPSDKFVSNTLRFERKQINFTNRTPVTHPINVELYNKSQNRNPIVPLCEIGNKGLYIDAQGRLFPCCWVANRYSHNTEWQQLANQFDLKQCALAEVLSDSFWKEEFQTFKWQECQTKCSSRVVNQDYATQW